MSPDILIVRENDGYRVLHGHLHLVNALSMSDEVTVDASGEGKVKVVKTSNGYLVDQDNHRIPLLGN
jgi:acetyl/propionyl-CoA carboxylase alpha subunit